VKRHLESCVRTAIRVRQEREEYEETYPMYCESCEGWGGIVEVDDPAFTLPSDIGDDSVDIDPCEDCIGKGLCPRCLNQYDPDEDEECSFCGFVLGTTEGMPYPHFCHCGESDDE